MERAFPFVILGLGTVTAVVATIELFQYRKFRQAYVNAGILAGTKKEG
jgi:hypothetical protein